MNKENVKAKLLDLATAELEDARAAYDEHLQASKPVEDEAVTEDEQAQTWSEAEIAEALEGPMRIAEGKISTLEALDFGPKTMVEPGAIITLDGRQFVIGVSMDHFTCEGSELTGLSPQAPIYQAIEGLKASETAEFDGRDLTVEKVV